MNRASTLLILCLLSLHFAHAQTGAERDSIDEKQRDFTASNSKRLLHRVDSTEKKDSFDEKDTTDIVNLNEVVLVSRFNFKDRRERRRYLILRKKTRHVWPYAVLASERLQELSQRLKRLDRGYKKSHYIKIVQRYIEKEFKDELKKLTKTEGQILVKLMYRQTGKTTFEVIKNLRSGWRAFWYNTTASLFNISLKKKYRPETVKEDYMIEHILRRSFQSGNLEQHNPKIRINFKKSTQKFYDERH